MSNKDIKINDCIRIAFRNCGYDVEDSLSDFEFKPLELKITGEIELVEILVLRVF